MNSISRLGFALLGLIRLQPQSGYDLRKIFTTTAMGSFSDSPGAIYPALDRLQKIALVRGTVQKTSSLRARRVFQITPKGLVAFKSWLKKPVTRDDVIRGVADLMLRFAFMDGALGAEEAIRFLSEFAKELEAYIPTLQQFLELHTPEMPLSGQLALQCGIQEYKVRLRWARTSAALYEDKVRKQI
jgi:DNA-binding PadR family transcriptional regulator